MKLTTKEWIRHLRHYIDTHSPLDKDYVLTTLEQIEQSLIPRFWPDELFLDGDPEMHDDFTTKWKEE